MTLELTKSERKRRTSSWSEDLEDEVAGLSTRSEKLKSELEVIEILSKEEWNWWAQSLSKNTRNNKKLFVTIENSLTKEVEFQELEIQLAEKWNESFYWTQEENTI
jgi:hypothetical protein